MPASDDKVLHISQRYYTRAETATAPRCSQNDDNWDAYLGHQDFSHKTSFQSKETTPGFPIAVEHIVGTFERALTDSDDWLSVDPAGVGEPFIEPGIIGELVQFYGSRLYQAGNHAETGYGIQCFVGDSCKRGIMEPRLIAKVYPVLVKRRVFRLQGEEPKKEESGVFLPHERVRTPKKSLKPVDIETIRIAVELIPFADYFPDPSPACRYEIHRTRRSLHELLSNPEYDQDAVRSLLGQANAETERRDKALRRGERMVGADPYEVEVYEAWGDIIDEQTGEILYENVFWVWANDKILRHPTPNPFWDGTRPFVTSALIRVPGSLDGKALADAAVPMWRCINELVNLLLDQSMRAAWGVGQVRADIMESPEEVADGIPQGYTAVIRPNTPQGLKFYERVDNGEAPQISLDQLQRLEGFLQESLAVPDTKLGQLPSRQTKATEVVQAMQASGSLYESFAARYEDTFLEPIFEKMWRLIMQYAEDFLEEEIVQILGPTNTIRLMELTAAERYKLLAKMHFKVRGLRGVATRERLFTKTMTIFNLLATNPQFADAFGAAGYSFEKLFAGALKGAGWDPVQLRMEEPIEGEVLPGSAGGQLDPTLAGASGASQPNIEATPQAAAGGENMMAPKNPNLNANAV